MYQPLEALKGAPKWRPVAIYMYVSKVLQKCIKGFALHSLLFAEKPFGDQGSSAPKNRSCFFPADFDADFFPGRSSSGSKNNIDPWKESEEKGGESVAQAYERSMAGVIADLSDRDPELGARLRTWRRNYWEALLEGAHRLRVLFMVLVPVQDSGSSEQVGGTSSSSHRHNDDEYNRGENYYSSSRSSSREKNGSLSSTTTGRTISTTNPSFKPTQVPLLQQQQVSSSPLSVNELFAMTDQTRENVQGLVQIARESESENALALWVFRLAKLGLHGVTSLLAFFTFSLVCLPIFEEIRLSERAAASMCEKSATLHTQNNCLEEELLDQVKPFWGDLQKRDNFGRILRDNFGTVFGPIRGIFGTKNWDKNAGTKVGTAQAGRPELE